MQTNASPTPAEFAKCPTCKTSWVPSVPGAERPAKADCPKCSPGGKIAQERTYAARLQRRLHGQGLPAGARIAGAAYATPRLAESPEAMRCRPHVPGAAWETPARYTVVKAIPDLPRPAVVSRVRKAPKARDWKNRLHIPGDDGRALCGVEFAYRDMAGEARPRELKPCGNCARLENLREMDGDGQSSDER